MTAPGTRDSTQRTPTDRPRDPTRQVEVEEHLREVEIVEQMSPEGRPAHPRFRTRTLVLLVGAAAAIFVIAAIIVAISGRPVMGILIGVLGVGFLVVGNPVVWASILRSRERERAHEEDRQ